MSRRNKVNPDHYTIAGRLAPDDWARERRKQNEQLFGATRTRQKKAVPPWMTHDLNDATASPATEAAEATGSGESARTDAVAGGEVTAGQPPRRQRAAATSAPAKTARKTSASPTPAGRAQKTGTKRAGTKTPAKRKATVTAAKKPAKTAARRPSAAKARAKTRVKTAAAGRAPSRPSARAAKTAKTAKKAKKAKKR